MLIKENYLVTINAKQKIQQVKLRMEKEEDSFSILRTTGIFGGKETPQPVLTITFGKAGRTIEEQANLQYNSLLKKYLDKGYKKLEDFVSKSYNEITQEDINNFLEKEVITNQFGIPKPMLAKLADDCSSDIWNKEWFVSRKLNGIRMLLYYRDGAIMSASRGGGEYDAATRHIRNNPKLLEIFHQNPDLILDGELYHHGVDWPLQRISGLARLKEWKDECGQLEYWIYDYVDTETPFIKRYEKLKSFRDILGSDSIIKILEQKPLIGYLAIKKEHDKYVKEGFEGLCARNPNKEYGINKRSSIYLVKLKMRKDAEATIIDVKEGLRPEDMCFVLKTPEGIVFSAKPIGAAETRVEYLKNKQDYIGKQMTYTYFELSKDGVPCQPVAIHIRPEDE